MNYTKWYKDKLISILNEIYETQSDAIEQAAQRMAGHGAQRQVHLCVRPVSRRYDGRGDGYRGGGFGLDQSHSYSQSDANVRPYAMTTQIERLPGLATITLENSSIQPGDCLIIHSFPPASPSSLKWP